MIQETFPIIVSGAEVLNERILLTQVENGLLMNGADSVRFIVILSLIHISEPTRR